MDLQLKGKTALISGSTQGIGFAIARKLSEEGAHVILNGRTTGKLNLAIEQLKAASGNETIVTGIQADFAKVEEVDRLIAQLPEIDILVNNVGIFAPKPFEEIKDDEWYHFFEVNVLSGIRLSRQLLPAMIKKNWGRILFISSDSAIQTPEEMIHYGFTKTAQLAISRGLAELTKGTQVTVNTLLPGPTQSEGVSDFIEQLARQKNMTPAQLEQEYFKTVRPTSLLQRKASVEEVANLAAFIASPLSSATNGAAIHVDGGVVRSIL